jgi:hypothetical protein
MFIKFLVIQIVLACYVDLLRPSNSLLNNSSLIRHFFLTNHFFIKQILKIYEKWLLKLTQSYLHSFSLNNPGLESADSVSLV